MASLALGRERVIRIHGADFYLTVPLCPQHNRKMQIHIARDGKPIGPFSLDEVNRQLAAGTMSLSDQAWYEGATGWAPLSTVPGVTTGGPTSTQSQLPGATGPGVPAIAAPTVAAPATAGQTEPLAIWSLVLSLLGLFCCGLLSGVPGIICGHLALSKIEKKPELQGRGLAIAGLIIGYFAALFWLLYLIFFGGLAMLRGILESTSK